MYFSGKILEFELRNKRNKRHFLLRSHIISPGDNTHICTICSHE